MMIRLRIPRIVVVLLAAASFPSFVAAEDGATTLDLGTCVERALAASDILRGRAAQSAAGVDRLSQAKYRRLPGVTATGSYTRSSESDGGTLEIGPTTVQLPSSLPDATVLRLQVQQPLFTGGRIEAGIAAADAFSRAASAEERATRTAVSASAERAYWALYLAQEGSAAAVENLAAAERRLGDARKRRERGDATTSEVLSWEQRRVQADLAARQAASRSAEAAAALSLLLGLPWNAPIRAADPGSVAVSVAGDAGAVGEGPNPSESSSDLRSAMPPAVDDDVVEESLKAARANRADLAAAASRSAAAAAAIDQARASLLPSLYLTGSFSYANPNPKVFPQQEGFEPLWDLGILASLDIGGIPGTLKRISEAEASASAARAQAAAALRSAELEVVKDALALGDARSLFASSAYSVALAEEQLRAQKERYAAGLAVEADLADAEAALLAARLGRVSARVSLELAAASLRDARGGSAEDLLGANGLGGGAASGAER